MICLDTNAIIAAINQRVPTVRRRVARAMFEGVTVAVPAIAIYEMFYGIRKSARPQANTALLTAFLELGVTPWSFEPDDAVEAAEIRAALERAGTPIGPYDILIAGQARRRGAVLVTANIGEFSRVPGLRVEDWTAAAE